MSKILRKPIVKTLLAVLAALLIYDIASAFVVKNYVSDKGEDASSFSGGLSRVG